MDVGKCGAFVGFFEGFWTSDGVCEEGAALHTDVGITREFYAVYATEELARLHRKHLPVAHLYGVDGGG
jgi:hypothetical protein